MLRPERMTSVSIFCVKRDVELVLEALGSFGEFHVEQTAETPSLAEYNQSIQRAEESLGIVNELSKQLITQQPGFMDIFRETQPTKMQVTAENWRSLQEIHYARYSGAQKRS